jgi:hypothetical protein
MNQGKDAIMSRNDIPQPHVARARRLKKAAVALAAVPACIALAAVSLPGGAIAAPPTSTKPPQTTPSALQIRALQGKVKDLEKLVAALENRTEELEGYRECEYVVPLVRFGDGGSSESFGYRWYDSDSTPHLTTAVDYIDEADFDPQYGDWFVAADDDCVDRSSRGTMALGRTR